MNSLGSMHTTSFGDFFLGLLTHFCISSQEAVLYVRKNEHVFLKEWFPLIKEVRVCNDVPDIDIHFRGYPDQRYLSYLCPWGYFTGKDLLYNKEKIKNIVNISGKNIPELDDSLIFFVDNGYNLTVNNRWYQSIINTLELNNKKYYINSKYSRINHPRNTNHISLQDLLYNIYTKNLDVITLRSGIADFCYIMTDNKMDVLYNNTPTWIKDTRLNLKECNLIKELVLKRYLKVSEYLEDHIDGIEYLCKSIK